MIESPGIRHITWTGRSRVRPGRGQARACRWDHASRTVPVRAVIAEDNRLVREGIEQILALDDGLEVAASCASLPELVDAIERTAPDLVLTDLRTPPSCNDEGIRVAAQLRET